MPTGANRYSQRLAQHPHPLRLELLVNVGYVSFTTWTCDDQEQAADDLIAITFLAQWHPLISPERNDLRPEYNNGPVKSPSFF